MNPNEVLSKEYLEKVSFDIKKPSKDEYSYKVLHLRLKDKHSTYLNDQARQVNLVWNFCNEHSMKVLAREHRFCSAFDMHPYLAGLGKAGLGLHSQTVQAISEEFVTRRKQFKKTKLKWRVSRGSKKSLGWIPFKSTAISYKQGQVVFNGKKLSLWDSYGLADYELCTGNINQDSRGRWFLNVSVKVRTWPCAIEQKKDVIGIDLGLKDFLAASDGHKAETQQFYRKAEKALATAQRANKSQRVKAIHAKIGNQRKDFLQKESTKLVKRCDAIFVGNVNSSGLAKTNAAKSVLDSGWSTFRAMLLYKCAIAGTWFKEVNEAYSTQTCSHCKERTGPKGQAELGVRKWTCSCCGAEHDRDINAAINIKHTGLKWLEHPFGWNNVQIAAMDEGKTCDSLVNKSSKELGVGCDPLAVGISLL